LKKFWVTLSILLILERPKCRVLEAEKDGKPATDNDPTCKLLYPGKQRFGFGNILILGYPADSLCKCTFQVNGRDKDGCAGK
jgi:hypothetical protein